jgi:hypothetical protein
MQNERPARSWGIAAVAVAAVAILLLILIVSGGISVKSAAQTREGKAKGAPVTLQWQPQSLIEARFHARLLQDVDILKERLDHLAGAQTCPDPADWEKTFSNHFLKNPRLWADGNVTETWKDVLPELYKIVKGSKDVTVNFAWGVIEYVPYDRVKKPRPEEDVDFIFKIKVTFSASPGDNVLEGELSHRRVCEIGS